MKVIKSFVAVLAMIDFVASFGNGANEDHSRRRLNSLKTPKLKRGKTPKGKVPKAKTPKGKVPKGAKTPKGKVPKNPKNPEPEPEPQYTLTATVELNFTIGINTDQLTSQDAIDNAAQVIEAGARQFVPEGSNFNVLSIGNNTVSSSRRLAISEVAVCHVDIGVSK